MNLTFSHSTTKRIITAMLAVFLVAALLMQWSCTAAKINKHTAKSEDTSASQTQVNENRKSSLFDRSRITQEDYSLRFIPIDPTKGIGHSVDKNTGAQQWQNAIPVYEKKTTQTNKDVTTNSEAAKTKATNQESKATTDETTKEKLKISVPWYAFLILGFFGFATILGMFLIYKLSKNISVFTGTFAALENRIKSLEK